MKAKSIENEKIIMSLTMTKIIMTTVIMKIINNNDDNENQNR